MATTNAGGKASKPKPRTFSATSTSEKQQNFNTRTGTASIGSKAKADTKMKMAPKKPDFSDVTLLPKRIAPNRTGSIAKRGR